MQYIILPLALIVFFELIGNIISNKYSLSFFKLDIVLGFSVFFATYEVPSFLFSYFHAKFIYLLFFTVLFLIFWAIYIFLNRTYLKIKLNKIELLIITLLIAIQYFFTLRYTVGSLFRFDTLTYANFITDNIYAEAINIVEPHNGNPGANYGYASQSIYLLASALYYLARGILTRIGYSFYYLSQHTWCYSTILYFIHAEMIINIINYFDVKKKLTFVLVFIFINLFMFNFYWNSQQAYLGNSFRMVLTSYMFIFMYDFFKHRNITDLKLFILFNIACVACANFNSIMACLFTFGIWLVIDENEREYQFIIYNLAIPSMCLAYQLTDGSILTFIIPLFVFVLARYYKIVNYLECRFKLKEVLGFAIALFLILGSYSLTKNFFNFSSFFDNFSGWSDMTWDYFDLSEPWMISANIVYYVILIILLFSVKENRIFKALLLITLIFFNPFAAEIQCRFVWTFYRNYDIVINFATIILVFKKIEDYKLSNLLLTVLIVFSAYGAYGQINYIPDPYFVKDEGYKDSLRMREDQIDVIDNVKSIMDTYDLKELNVITYMPNLRTEIPSLKTLYGRNKQWSGLDEELELVKIFYPVDHYADIYRPGEPDLKNACEYIKNSKYQMIVQDKKIEYYDEDLKEYLSYTYLINECGTYPAYENDRYAIYYYADK